STKRDRSNNERDPARDRETTTEVSARTPRHPTSVGGKYAQRTGKRAMLPGCCGPDGPSGHERAQCQGCRSVLCEEGPGLQGIECKPHFLVALLQRHRGFAGDEPRGSLLGTVLHDIGHDALAVDRSTGWREVARRRELDGPTARERHDGLHGALTVGLVPDQLGAAVILQSARHNLRGGCRAA